MLNADIYVKPDDGSLSNWRLWTGSIAHKDLISVGGFYIKITKNRSQWNVRYKMGDSGLSLPSFFRSRYATDQQVEDVVHEFANWVLKHPLSLHEANERYVEERALDSRC